MRQMSMTITLREVTRDNWYAVASLRLDEGQDKFVWHNWYSLLEALYSDGKLHSRAIYLDETPIGYVMYGYNPKTDEYSISRLMTDKDQQHKGYGRQAMELIIEHMKQTYACKEIFIGFNPTNVNARKFYESVGFVDTGRIEDEEFIFRLPLEG
jgi:diamine N-acetyltransferase